MLSSLSIRHIVLIKALDLDFSGNLSVLSGETGAGKSILLDSLGLALGMRGDTGLIRSGETQASVTACFEGVNALVAPLLEEHGIALTNADEALMLKRTLSTDGRSKAFVNGEPVALQVLRRIADVLVEIHGQFDNHRLLKPACHLQLLDGFARSENEKATCTRLWHAWSAIADDVARTRDAMTRTQAEEDYLRHALDELVRFEALEGEEAILAEKRTLLMNAEKLLQALSDAETALGGKDSTDAPEDAIGTALRALSDGAVLNDTLFNEAIEALERALVETREAVGLLNTIRRNIHADGTSLEEVEERLFAIRALARKYETQPDKLHLLRDDFQRQLDGITHGAENLAALERKAQESRQAWLDTAINLREKRARAAKTLTHAVNAELPALYLLDATFSISMNDLDENAWGPNGMDGVNFMLAANPNVEAGPIAKIASGGELSRLMLALKAVLAKTDAIPTLVFDEVDSGIGGGAAAAVGERLRTLAQEAQVLVVTHSPQVAAAGKHHYRIIKQKTDDGTNETNTTLLDENARLEEVARMLSAYAVTDEARRAAATLLTPPTTP